MEEVYSPEKSINVYHTARYHILEGTMPLTELQHRYCLRAGLWNMKLFTGIEAYILTLNGVSETSRELAGNVMINLTKQDSV
jgi:hypothetical protein